MNAAMQRQLVVAAEGVSLSVVRAGRGEPVVCLSAVGHDAYDYLPLAQRLGHRYEFICIEWPLHGESGADSEPASAARYAALTEVVLQQLEIRAPLVIGNSIGGAVGILYAARYCVRGLVLCDSGGLLAVDAKVARFCRVFSRFFAAGARGAWWFKTLFGLYYRWVLPTRAANGQRRRIVASAYRIAAPLAQAWRSFGAPAADIRDVAAQLSVPVWVAWAKHDRVIPLRLCQPALARLKNTRLDVFAGGHSPFLEQADEFAVKFDHFAAGLTSAEGGGGAQSARSAA